jgi:hypothetical protein
MAKLPNDEGPFEPPIADRELPHEVVDAREFAAELRATAEESVACAIAARCGVYVETLDAFASLLVVPLETSDLDLAARTRWAALWPLAGRSLSLGRALVHLVERGFCSEAFPVARTVHETNRLLRTFAHPDGADLARQWLDGKTPKPSAITRALNRFEADDDRRRVEAGEAPAPPKRGEAIKLYRELSEAGHAARGSMRRSFSHSLRELVIGPNPDFAVRAYHVSWAGAVVWEIGFHASMVLAFGVGQRFRADYLQPLLDRLKAVDSLHPFPQEHVRSHPLELVEVEDEPS